MFAAALVMLQSRCDITDWLGMVLISGQGFGLALLLVLAAFALVRLGVSRIAGRS